MVMLWSISSGPTVSLEYIKEQVICYIFITIILSLPLIIYTCYRKNMALKRVLSTKGRSDSGFEF